MQIRWLLTLVLVLGCDADPPMGDDGGRPDVPPAPADAPEISDASTADSGPPTDAGAPGDTGAPTDVDAAMDAGALLDGGGTTLGALDVNDVAVLFPIPSDGDFSPLLPLSEQLSSTTFTRLVAATPDALSGDPTMEVRAFPLERWHVIALVLDPCARGHAAGACVPELRLVAQPDTTFAGAPALADHAIHLTYRFDDVAFDALVADWLRVRATAGESVAGAPLGVHPVLARQGLDGALASALNELIRSHATPARLAVVAATFADGFTWFFLRHLTSTGAIDPSLPCAGRANVAFSFLGAFSEIAPTPTCPVHAGLLVAGFETASASSQEAAIASGLRISNPSLVGSDETDCASCHVASRRLVAHRGLPFLFAEDGRPERFLAPDGVTMDFVETTHEVSTGYPVRAFGYERAAPSFTPRMLAVAARAVEVLRTR